VARGAAGIVRGDLQVALRDGELGPLLDVRRVGRIVVDELGDHAAVRARRALNKSFIAGRV